ncbi:transcription factor BTF3 homolog isoform X2 [Triticum dicoccoides]|nr:transcription factor BTF3 homolog isoform X2 [Triticum dicoccoides]
MAAMNGKKKAIHKTTATDDKRLQRTLKSVGVNTVLGIKECKNPSLQTPRLSVEHHGLKKIPLRRLSPNGCADRPVPLTN